MFFKKNFTFAKNKKPTMEAPIASSSQPSELHAQYPTRASPSTKIRLSMMSTAMVDALGGPAEFHSRFSFPFVSSMQPNNTFRLPAGVWTDDTSMTLCLAKSISTPKPSRDSADPGGFDEAHQLKLYRRWHRDGYLSPIGRCFDVGNTISRALALYNRYRDSPADALAAIHAELSDDANCGNGSLMRVLPIGLAYWRDEGEAKALARRSSQVTHPAPLCVEACQFWTALIVLIMGKTTEAPGNAEEPPFSKLSLLEFINRYPFEDHRLVVALTLPYGLPSRPDDLAEKEEYYFKYHPLLRIIAATQMQRPLPKDSKFGYHIPPVENVRSTGFVLDTLVAALYCFFATRTFEDGALMAVNLGFDADTVGAVYAGLAAVWYAGTEEDAEGVFWTERVREWRKDLVATHLIEEVTDSLVDWEQKQADSY